MLIEDYSLVLDQDGKGHVIRINEGIRRMNSIIDDILALSKNIAAGDGNKRCRLVHYGPTGISEGERDKGASFFFTLGI